MKEQLISYVNLLFVGASDCDDIRQEILQNTLDRYDDLIAEGKAPEAAYRLAICGIGDINEILGQNPCAQPLYPAPGTPAKRDTPTKKVLRAVAVALYILSPLPLIVLADTGLEIYGLCGVLTFVAVATALIMLGAPSREDPEAPVKASVIPGQATRRSIGSVLSTLMLILYFLLSLVTGAWAVTLLIFPIGWAAKGLIWAILDLKECLQYEN